MIYSAIITRAVTRAHELKPDVSINLLQMAADASFFSANSQVAESFAARENKRPLLLVPNTLSFTVDPDDSRVGLATIPSSTLKKYLDDASLFVGTVKYGYRPLWSDFLISGPDNRLGKWSTRGETVGATKPTSGGALTTTATFYSICSPANPTSASEEFVAPDDYIPELLDTLTLLTINNAAIDKIAENV